MKMAKGKRFFNFVKPGKYATKAQNMRLRQLKREMRNTQYEVKKANEYEIYLKKLKKSKEIHKKY